MSVRNIQIDFSSREKLTAAFAAVAEPFGALGGGGSFGRHGNPALRARIAAAFGAVVYGDLERVAELAAALQAALPGVEWPATAKLELPRSGAPLVEVTTPTSGTKISAHLFGGENGRLVIDFDPRGSIARAEIIVAALNLAGFEWPRVNVVRCAAA